MNYDELLKPSVLKNLTVKFGFKPTKHRGQNYLISRTYVDQMILAAKVDKKTKVIEIGPGFGILTIPLAQKAKHVFAFELEKSLESYWHEMQEQYDNIEIIWGDALKNIPTFLEKHHQAYTVVANLPFQVTSAVIRLFLENEHQPQNMVLIVQKEVADRICAKPGEMSLLSLSVQLFGEPKIITKIPKGNFWPSPEVDSAVIGIKNIKQPKNAELIFTLAKAGFSSRRKQLWRNLSQIIDLDHDILKQIIGRIARGNEKIRAQELSVKEWLLLAERLRESV